MAEIKKLKTLARERLDDAKQIKIDNEIATKKIILAERAVCAAQKESIRRQSEKKSESGPEVSS